MPYDTYEEKKPAPDLSYLSAQPPLTSTATAGMPVALAAVANRNLAAEDASNARVNAVRSNVVTPPDTATPVSAQVAPEPAAPDTGVDLNLVNQRRNLILRGIDPDAPAIYPSDRPTGHGGISRRQELQHELGVLTTIAHQGALQNAQDAHENYKQHRDIESADQFTGLVNGLANMKSQPGTPEHAQELLGLIQQYPLGSQSKAALALLKTHATTHAEHKTLQESMQDYRDATGLEPDSIETTATGGFNLRGNTSQARAPKTDKIPSHTLDRYAKLQGEIAQHEAASDAEAKANTKGKMPDTPYSGSAKWAAAQKEIAILEKAHPVLKNAAPAPQAPNISQADYDKLQPGDSYPWNGKTLTKAKK